MSVGDTKVKIIMIKIISRDMKGYQRLYIYVGKKNTEHKKLKVD